MKFHIKTFETLDSTNIHMQDMMSENEIEEGFVITADFQTSGKGNSNNAWESEKGKNLIFSVLLKPDFIEAENQFVITQIISLSVLNALSSYTHNKNLKIKWHNDIYYSNQKIAGILIQNTIKGSKISDSVVGIGINVNQEQFISDAPNPVSLIQIINKETDRDILFKRVLDEIKDCYSRLMLFPNTSWIERKYLDNFYKKDELMFFRDKDGVFEGRIQGIDTYGRLIINTVKNEEKIYGFKEVEFILPEL